MANGNGNGIGVKFDRTITLGNVLTIVSLVMAGFAAYLSIEIRISMIDTRTIDYATIKETVLKNNIRMDSLQDLVNHYTNDTRQIAADLSTIKAQQAADGATLKIIADTVRGK